MMASTCKKPSVLVALPSRPLTINQDLVNAIKGTAGLKTVALNVEIIKHGICRLIHAFVVMDTKE